MRVQSNVASFGAIYQDIRAALVRRFPYVIYYRLDANGIVVIAVQHGRRDWSSWQSRA